MDKSPELLTIVRLFFLVFIAAISMACEVQNLRIFSF